MENSNALTLMLILLLLFPSQIHSNINPIRGRFRFSNYTDEQSLVAFKSHITSDPQRVLESWNSSTPFCSWRGVTCNVTKQRVTYLYLNSLGLVGIIAPHLGNLTFLCYLRLANNSISGRIPQEIGKLPRLKGLELWSNHLEGPIPASLGLCSQLTYLGLQWNGLQGRIPSELGKLSKLNDLYLADNLLTGPIPYSLGNLSLLKNIRLSRNRLTGPIPSELGKLSKLSELHLRRNLLTGPIPHSLGNLSSLKSIYLSENRLTGPIPSELGKLSKLSELHLAANFLTGPIPDSLRNLSSLKSIYLRENRLTGPIPEVLGQLPILLVISMDENQLDGEIPPSIFNMSSLNILSLEGNRLSGTLPSNMFSELSNLTIIYLSQNRFFGNLPVSLGNASSLVKADFGTNNFNGHIPLLWNLPKLQFLSFGDNKLVSDGDHGWDFLMSLANSTQLQVFAFGNNLATGKLPSSIGNLSRYLSKFYIFENHLEGSLPTEVGNLVNLIRLSAHSNSFSGNIPSSLGNLTKLQHLGLEINNFSGEIPKSLANLNALSYMSLYGNSLTGVIPSIFGNLQHLEILDLSDNMLNGSILIEIFNITSLDIYLNLSINSLSGHIPDQIGNLKMIGVIDLSSNHLTGDIPSSIGGCSSLDVLNLSHNALHGQIPSAIGDMKGLETIDLSSNNLIGEIPSSLDSLPFLRYLNLSMNQLEGSIPSTGVFTNTTIVSLFGNPRLCGGIPKFNLPKCNLLNAKRSRSKLIIGLVVGLVAPLTLIVGLLVFLLLRKRWQRKAPNVALEIVFPHEYKLFSYYELKSATANFSPQNLIGKGRFGSVYKATFTDETIVAIKVFDLKLKHGSKIFVAECEALRNVRHRNLVKIITVCSTENFKALILPFMPNGSLDQWLHKESESNEEDVGWLDLRHRLKIIKEVASAMEYLHHDCETPIVHCDLKPSNVLIDADMNAHVADFGIARILNASNNHPTSSTLGLKGSIGYVAPEYGLGGAVSTKGDVYSFGILVLEMFTGKRPTHEEFTGDVDLTGWVAKGLMSNVADILDQNLVRNEFGSNDYRGLINILDIGLRCATTSPDVRPTMRDVFFQIENIVV